jgi:hypothetical protein
VEVTYREFNPEIDLSDRGKLFLECFPETAVKPSSSMEHYAWKHHSTDGSYEFSAALGPDLVGYYASINYSYIWNKSNTVIAGMVCDVMTGSKSRGKGVFSNLGLFATDHLKGNGVDFTTGYPIRDAVIPGHVKAGWDVAFPLPLYVKLCSLDSIAKKCRVGAIAPILNVFIKAASLPFTHGMVNKNVAVSQVEIADLVNDPNYLALIERSSLESGLSLIKSKKFMLWRLGAPESDYTIIKACTNGILSGYLIARQTERFGISCLGIVDLVSVDGGVGSTKLMIKETCKINRSCDVVLLMCNQSVYRRYKLYFCGFLKSPFKFRFIFKNLSGRIPNIILKDEKSWNLTWIDSDDL